MVKSQHFFCSFRFFLICPPFFVFSLPFFPISSSAKKEVMHRFRGSKLLTDLYNNMQEKCGASWTKNYNHTHNKAAGCKNCVRYYMEIRRNICISRHSKTSYPLTWFIRNGGRYLGSGQRDEGSAIQEDIRTDGPASFSANLCEHYIPWQ